MVTTEAVICFLIWVAYGWTVWRRGPQIRARYRQIERNKRVIASIWLMIGGLLVLIFGLFGASQLPGQPKGSFNLFGWLIVAIVGCIFVHGQTLAAAIMATLVEPEVTKPSGQASQTQETEGLES